MSEPVPIRDASCPADETVVELLERYLALAKAGKLRGVIVLGDMPGESDCDSAGRWDGPKVMWAVECWKHRFLHKIQEGL